MPDFTKYRKSSNNIWSATINQSTAAVNKALKAAPSTGYSLYVTDIVVSNGATAGNIKLVENTTSSTDIVELLYLAINGGASLNFRTPIKLTAGKNLGFTSATVTTHSLLACGFTAP